MRSREAMGLVRHHRILQRMGIQSGGEVGAGWKGEGIRKYKLAVTKWSQGWTSSLGNIL